MSQPVARAGRRLVPPAADRELAVQLGDSAFYLSHGIWVKDLTGSNAAAGATFLAQRLSSLLAPLTGHLVDRTRGRPVLIVANAVTGAGVLSLLLVHGPQQLWLMYAVAVGYGASLVVIGPASAGLVKDLLPDKDLAGANAAFVTARQGLRVASPLAGAGLYAGFGGGSLAILDAATFAIAVAVLVTIRVDESPVSPAGHAPVRQALLAGLRYPRATRALAQITAAAMAAMVDLGFYESLTFAVIAALGRPPSFFGVLMSVRAAGSILGGLATAPLIRRVGEARTLGAGLAASLVYIIRSVPAACTALANFGIALPRYAAALSTASQRFTPPRLQGRTGAATTMLTNLSQTLSIAAGAALITVVDYRILLVVVTAVTAATALPVLLRPARTPAGRRTERVRT